MRHMRQQGGIRLLGMWAKLTLSWRQGWLLSRESQQHQHSPTGQLRKGRLLMLSMQESPMYKHGWLVMPLD